MLIFDLKDGDDVVASFAFSLVRTLDGHWIISRCQDDGTITAFDTYASETEARTKFESLQKLL